MGENWNSYKSLIQAVLFGVIAGIAISIFVAIKYNLIGAVEVDDAPATPEQESVAVDNNSVSLTAHTIATLDLLPAFVEDEMARNGRIFRKKIKVDKAVDSTVTDERIRADILAMLTNDPVLSGIVIKVQCRKGKVILSGDPLSPGAIGRAIVIAYNTVGVVSVLSHIEVKPKQKK